MLTLLIAATLGAYASQRISFVRDGEIASMSIDYQRVIQDAIALFSLFGLICSAVFGAGKWLRAYVDQALIPWLDFNFGIYFELPSLPSNPAFPILPQDFKVQ